MAVWMDENNYNKVEIELNWIDDDGDDGDDGDDEFIPSRLPRKNLGLVSMEKCIIDIYSVF